MNPLVRQLAGAYREEEELYQQIVALVERQCRAIGTERDPAQVLDLCRQVEEMMARVEAVEQAIEPAKREWEKTRQDPGGELDAVLGSVLALIDRVALLQQTVQQSLIDYVKAQRQVTEGAQAAVSAGKARKLYRAG